MRSRLCCRAAALICAVLLVAGTGFMEAHAADEETVDEHVYERIPEWYEPPSCEESGKDWYICVAHHDYLCWYEVPALGHDFVKTGERQENDTQVRIFYRCSRCDKTQERLVARSNVKKNDPAESTPKKDNNKSRPAQKQKASGSGEKLAVKEADRVNEKALQKPAEETRNGVQAEEKEAFEDQNSTQKTLQQDSEKSTKKSRLQNKINLALVIGIVVEAGAFAAVLAGDVRVILWHRKKRRKP